MTRSCMSGCDARIPLARTVKRRGVEKVGTVAVAGKRPWSRSNLAMRIPRMVSCSSIIRAGISSQPISNRKSAMVHPRCCSWVQLFPAQHHTVNTHETEKQRDCRKQHKAQRHLLRMLDRPPRLRSNQDATQQIEHTDAKHNPSRERQATNPTCG